MIIITGLQTASEETCKLQSANQKKIQARTVDLLLAFAVDNQMTNCASLYSI